MELALDRLRNDFDTPWKEILDFHFKPFLELCYPIAASLINWSKGYETLDKELNAITKDAELGKRIADKLIKVWRLDGSEAFVLFHVEIQAQRQKNFSERMFVYHYRLFDLYHKPIVSVAILADDHAAWRPNSYDHELWGCRLQFDFIAIKLLDYEKCREELLKSNNPFAIVILAHLAALKTKESEEARFVSKIKLTRSLYEKGWSKKAVVNLYSFIDYIMALPEPLELKYLKEIESIEQEKNMTYITSAERFGIEKGMQEGLQLGLQKGIQEGIQKGRLEGRQEGRQEGLQKGIQEGEKMLLLHLLRSKFGALPNAYLMRIETAVTAQLLEWATLVISAKSLEDIFKISG